MTPERFAELTARNRDALTTINATRAYLVKGLMCYEVDELIAEINQLHSQLAAARNEFVGMIAQCREANRLTELLREVVLSGVVYEVPGKYRELQVSIDLLAEIDAVLKGPTP